MVFDTIGPVMMPVAARRCPPATGRGSDYVELSREVKQAGLLNRRPGYYTAKVGVNQPMWPIPTQQRR